jgi:hypothetical protein
VPDPVGGFHAGGDGLEGPVLRLHRCRQSALVGVDLDLGGGGGRASRQDLQVAVGRLADRYRIRCRHRGVGRACHAQTCGRRRRDGRRCSHTSAVETTHSCSSPCNESKTGHGAVPRTGKRRAPLHRSLQMGDGSFNRHMNYDGRRPGQAPVRKDTINPHPPGPCHARGWPIIVAAALVLIASMLPWFRTRFAVNDGWATRTASAWTASTSWSVAVLSSAGFDGELVTVKVRVRTRSWHSPGVPDCFGFGHVRVYVMTQFDSQVRPLSRENSCSQRAE